MRYYCEVCDIRTDSAEAKCIDCGEEMTLTRRWVITVEMESPYNPDKWDWDELVADAAAERVESVRVHEVASFDREVTA